MTTTSSDGGDDSDSQQTNAAAAAAEAAFLDSYLLFDLLGDRDHRVVNMFSSAVATLETTMKERERQRRTAGAARTRARASSVTSKITACTGGVYVLGNNDAIFKPRCEEAAAAGVGVGDGNGVGDGVIGDANPLRRGFKLGDGAIREVAAYQLDRAAGHFAGVPPTTLISVRSDVIKQDPTAAAGPAVDGEREHLEGSLQKYVANIGSSEDYGSSSFQLQQLQAVALLDIRLFNTDRHGGNMLVAVDDAPHAPHAGARRSNVLVPIDHGLCLPDFQHLGEFEASWLFWREAREELTPASRAHVAALDADRDAATLRGLNVREPAILTMRLMTHFLKFAVLELNWTLHAIGVFLTQSHLTATPPTTPSAPTAAAAQSGENEFASDFQALLVKAAAGAADASLVGFLSGDEAVAFSEERARNLLEAAQSVWQRELLTRQFD